MKCWRCQTPLKAPGYCGSCSFELDRERIWTDAGFNPDGTTPFAPEPEPVDEAKRSGVALGLGKQMPTSSG